MAHHILLASKELRDIQDMTRALAMEDGIVLVTASSGEEAIDLVWKRNPVLVVLVANFSDLSAFEVAGILRKNDQTNAVPLVLLGHGGPEEEVKALKRGFRDYMAMPFHREVFVSRVERIIADELAKKEDQDEDELLVSGDITLNLSQHTVAVLGEDINLTPKEFALLYLFIKKKNRALSRVFLSGTIWEHEYFETSNTIDRHIANLRKKLGSEGRKIVTVPTIGYRYQE